jgi:uncharacterized membrane protein YsdA (DUF1294 family)
MSTSPVHIALGLFIAINLVSFIVTANDKRESLKGSSGDRTPEGLLFFLAAAFGGAGVYLAMLIFRHKTRRWYFQLGIPLLILQNLALLYVIKEYWLPL